MEFIEEGTAWLTVIDRDVFGVLAAHDLAGAVQKKDEPVPVYAGVWSQRGTRRGGAIGKPVALSVEAVTLQDLKY
jgi:hypothetical protein